MAAAGPAGGLPDSQALTVPSTGAGGLDPRQRIARHGCGVGLDLQVTSPCCGSAAIPDS